MFILLPCCTVTAKYRSSGHMNCEFVYRYCLCSFCVYLTLIRCRQTKPEINILFAVFVFACTINGLGPETSVQLYQTCVLPTLVYRLEVILPKQRFVDALERCNKKCLKYILAIPTTTAEPAIYTLTGSIPLEGIIHKHTLSLFGNICRLYYTSVKKKKKKKKTDGEETTEC